MKKLPIILIILLGSIINTFAQQFSFTNEGKKTKEIKVIGSFFIIKKFKV